MATSKYKTRLCFWGDKCRNKKKCTFAHTIEELRPLDKIQQPCMDCICQGCFPYYPEQNIGKNINTVNNICNNVTYLIDDKNIIRSYIDKCKYIHNKREIKIKKVNYDSDECYTPPPIKEFITSPKLANRRLFGQHFQKPNPIKSEELPLLECPMEISERCNPYSIFDNHSPDSGFKLIST